MVRGEPGEMVPGPATTIRPLESSRLTAEKLASKFSLNCKVMRAGEVVRAAPSAGSELTRLAWAKTTTRGSRVRRMERRRARKKGEPAPPAPLPLREGGIMRITFIKDLFKKTLDSRIMVSGLVCAWPSNQRSGQPGPSQPLHRQESEPSALRMSLRRMLNYPGKQS